jgi:outer membrane protein assembly factor BamB
MPADTEDPCAAGPAEPAPCTEGRLMAKHRCSSGILLAGTLAWLLVVPIPSEAQFGGRMGGQGHFRPDSKFDAERLFNIAAEHERTGQWAEAVTIYQRILQRFGETMSEVPADDGKAPGRPGETRLFVDTRHYCQRRLAAMPAEARAIYRHRVDSEAERWYRQGLAERDRTLLRRVVIEAFCSSWGDDALDVLGDLAFQEGRFGEALENYRRLLPGRPGEPGPLVHPDADVDRARVAAKAILCRAALGVDRPGRADLEAFAQDYPDAKGPFAGRNGPLVKCLAEALAADHMDQTLPADGRWPTFAGAPTRTKVLPGPIDVGSFLWKVKLEPPLALTRQTSNGFGGMGRGFGGGPPQFRTVPAEKLLPYHPIVVGDQVVVSDARKVVSYSLAGAPAASPPTVAAGAGEEPQVVWEQTPLAPFATGNNASAAHFTLTAYGDRVYARLGPTAIHQQPSYLIAMRNTREIEGKLLWKHPASDIELPRRGGAAVQTRSAFEGAPVADGQHVYVALTEANQMIYAYVACLDADTGNAVWVRSLGSAAAPFNDMMGAPSPNEVGGRLLTLDGSTLYYQTNLGAVVALDAETGSIKWLATYDHQEPHGGAPGNGRDLNPAVVQDGLVLAAPDDSSHIYAFDAATGRLVWRTEEMTKVVHLLGVAKGHVFLTGDRCYMLDLKTGKRLRQWPEVGPQEPYGRGVLAGDSVYWPTKDKIFVLSQETGVPDADRPPILLKEAFGVSGGNLAVGDGYLIVAQSDQLLVFCQNSRLIERYREQIAKAPEDASMYVRLARVAEATGQDELALTSLEGAVERARPAELFDGQPLADQARLRRFALLMKIGAKAGRDTKWAEAVRRYHEAARSARADRDRLTARLRLADAQVRAEDPRAAVATLQAILGEEALRRQSVAADERRTVRADLLIADRLATLLRDARDKHGDLYTEYERQALDLLERGRSERDPHLLEEIGRSFPAAKVLPDALLELALLRETEHPADAARVYKRLLALAPAEPLRARALWGLGRAYEAQKLWLPARDAYLRAQARYGDVRLEERGFSGTIGSLVAERLARGPFDRMAPADRVDAAVSLPVGRGWRVSWGREARPLVADGTPPIPELGSIFIAEGTVLRPIDPNSGSSAWAANLEGEPLWAAYLPDRIVAATAERIVALDLQTGAERWSFQAVERPPPRRRR